MKIIIEAIIACVLVLPSFVFAKAKSVDEINKIFKAEIFQDDDLFDDEQPISFEILEFHKVYPKDKHFNQPMKYKRPDYKRDVKHCENGDVIHEGKLSNSITAPYQHIHSIMTYYGLGAENDLEIELVRRICGTESEYKEAMELFAKTAQSYGLVVEPLKENVFQSIKAWIDRGIPIYCNVYVDSLMELKPRTKLRSKMGIEEWAAEVQKLSLSAPQRKYTYNIFITGYNAKTGEIRLTCALEPYNIIYGKSGGVPANLSNVYIRNISKGHLNIHKIITLLSPKDCYATIKKQG